MIDLLIDCIKFKEKSLGLTHLRTEEINFKQL